MNNLPMEWGVRAMTAPTVEQACEEFLQAVVARGFDNACLLLDQPRFDVGFPEEHRLYGHMISASYHDYCRGEGATDCETSFRVAEASSRELTCRIDLDNIDTNEALSAREARMVTVMREFGMRAGWTLPVLNTVTQSFSVLLVDTQRVAKHLFNAVDRDQMSIHSSLVFLTEGLAVRNLQANIPDRREGVLSPRESDCLAWVAAGKSSKHIADLLNLSPCTVNEYISSACKKLKATNRAHAAARATLMGMVAA